MDYLSYYEKNKTYIKYKEYRIELIIKMVKEVSPMNVLDIGCGDGFLLNEIKKELPDSRLVGIDVYKTNVKDIKIDVGDITKKLPYKNNKFECVILGEVIEHVPDPDFVLSEIRRVLKKDGVLIISTPNLVSWANRIMVLLGVQPFYTETSVDVNLGRYFKVLGQGGKVQGHLKVFTFKSLEEILVKEKFEIVDKKGVPFYFPFPISLVDRLFAKIIPLSSGLVYIAKR